MAITKSILKQTCAEDNAVGGNLNRVFVAKLGDAVGQVKAFTVLAGRIAALTFEGTASMVELWTRQDGVTFPSDTPQTERGAGRVATQTLNAIIKKQGVEYREALKEILACNNFIVIVVNNATQEIQVGGVFSLLDTDLVVSKGMRPSLTKTEDASFADEASQTITFVGETVEFAGMVFGTGVYATDIVTLEGYLAP